MEKVLDDELVQLFILRGIALDLTFIKKKCSDLILFLQLALSGKKFLMPLFQLILPSDQEAYNNLHYNHDQTLHCRYHCDYDESY